MWVHSTQQWFRNDIRGVYLRISKNSFYLLQTWIIKLLERRRNHLIILAYSSALTDMIDRYELKLYRSIIQETIAKWLTLTWVERELRWPRFSSYLSLLHPIDTHSPFYLLFSLSSDPFHPSIFVISTAAH